MLFLWHFQLIIYCWLHTDSIYFYICARAIREMTLPTKCRLTLLHPSRSKKCAAYNNFRLCMFEISSWRPTENLKEQYYACRNELKTFSIRERSLRKFQLYTTSEIVAQRFSIRAELKIN